MKNYFLLFLFLLTAIIFPQQISTNKDSLTIFGNETLIVFNSGNSNLVLDTLYSVNPYYGYWLDIFTNDTTFGYYSVSNVIDPTPLNLILQPNDMARFVFGLVDLCIICKVSNVKEYFTDTLILVSNSIENDTLFLFVEGEGILSSVEEENIVTDYELKQNYPNPFNPITTISYSIPENQFVQIIVFDLLGNKVASLVNEYNKAGFHSIQFNGHNLSSGIYFYKLITENFIQTKKLILLK